MRHPDVYHLDPGIKPEKSSPTKSKTKKNKYISSVTPHPDVDVETEFSVLKLKGQAQKLHTRKTAAARNYY